MTAKKIAIACQGGGTHAAFTWGVLRQLLKTKQKWDEGPDDGATFDIVAVSGTSAGALCALATWYGLVPNTADANCGSIAKAVDRLDFLWTTFGAVTPIERAHNDFVGLLLKFKEMGVPLPGFNPYDIYDDLALTTLGVLGARGPYMEFPKLLDAICPHFEHIDWSKLEPGKRRLLVGAIEVLSGNFEVFDSDKNLEHLNNKNPGGGESPDSESAAKNPWRIRRPLSLKGVAASGTLPEILEAQRIPNLSFPEGENGKAIVRDGHYWDGLYSQNPPVRELLDLPNRDDKPEEIWVVRINPQQQGARKFLEDVEDRTDRENELAGNVSLNQELDHILTINRWLRKHGENYPPMKKRRIVTVRTIKMARETAGSLQRTTKFDRDPQRLAELRDEGSAVAERWLAEWRERKDDFESYPLDARYTPDL